MSASDSINSVRFESAAATSSTDVVVKAFGSGALQGILEAISKTNTAVKGLQTRMDSVLSNSEQEKKDRNKKEKDDEKEYVASLASERRSRATQEAVYGEVKKGNIFNKMLREGLMDALNGLTSFLKDNLGKALKTQQDLATTMRKANLSHDQKNQIQQLAVSMKEVVAAKFDGLDVSNAQIKDYISDLIAAGKDITTMKEHELAGYIAMRRRNMEAEKAYETAKTASYESVRKLSLATGDNQVQASINKLMGSIDKNQMIAMGGTDKAIAQVTEIARGLEAKAGGVMSPEDISTLAMAIFKKNNLNLLGSSSLSDDEKNILAVVGNNTKDMGVVVEKLISSSNTVTSSLGAFMPSVAALKEARANGSEIGKNLMSDNEIRDANKTNTAEGKLPSFLESIYNKTLGKVTGPLINTMDEWFGEGVDITKIVGTGFKIVIGLLGSIVHSELFKNPMTLLASLIGSIGNLGIFGKIKDFFKKKPSDNTPKVPKGPKTPRDLDKEYEEAVKKLKNLPSYLKNAAKECFDKLKTVPGSIKKSASGAFDRIKQSASGLKNSASSAFSSIKRAFKNAPRTIKSTFSDIRKRGVIAMTKIPGMFKGMGGKMGGIGKGLLGGIGIASGVLGVLGATGAFDSLTPILQDFSKTIAPVLKELVDTLAPTIQSLLTSLGPSLQEIVKSLAPVLDSVLKAVAPILTKVIQSLVPVLDSVFKSLTPILDSVFKTLAPVLDSLVQTVMPIFSSLVETLMPIIQTVLDVLTPILSTILSSLGPIIKTIASVATPILKVIGSVLKSISPIFSAVLKPIAAALDFILTPLKLIAELLQNESQAKNTAEASGAAESALAAGDVETANKARAVQVGYAQGKSKVERREGESDKSYYARAYKEMFGDKANDITNDNFTKHIFDEIEKGVKAQDKSWSGIGDNFAGKDIEYWRDLPDAALIEELGQIFGFTEPYSDQQKETLRTAISKLDPKRKKVELANGGVFNQATDAVVGEDGKEAVLPLTKQDQLLKVLSSLTLSESRKLLESVLASKNFSADNLLTMFSKYAQPTSSSTATSAAVQAIANGTVPGDDPATIRKILSYAGPFSGFVYNLLLHGKNGKYKDAFKQRKKWYEEALANAANQEGRELIRGTYAERALEYGVSELGKPYILRSLGKIGYVCNELVNACIQASGFNMGKFRVHGVKATFANIQKGKYSGEEYPNFRIRTDLTPQTAIPGMVFFQDARKNKEGGFQPGHIGLVYYGHQKLHSSGGSSKYTKTEFLPNWQTPCRGVTVTPFDGGSYVIGEFPGLFEQASGEWKAPTNSPIQFGPGAEIGASTMSDIDYTDSIVDAVLATNPSLSSSTEFQSILNDYTTAIQSIKESASNEAKQTAAQFGKSAIQLMGANKNSAEILSALTTMIKYLRDIAASPANKKQIPTASRPISTAY